MNRPYREWVLAGRSTPVSGLSGAFLRPQGPMGLQFAYYQSSLVVEFLIERHGFDKLKLILDELGQGTPINRALERHAGSLEDLDREAEKHVRSRAADMASKADWSFPALPLVVAVLGSGALSAGAGVAASARALRRKPWDVLRGG